MHTTGQVIGYMLVEGELTETSVEIEGELTETSFEIGTEIK